MNAEQLSAPGPERESFRVPVNATGNEYSAHPRALPDRSFLAAGLT
jgi:hypothetical protein